jgi:DNA-binding NarL/FixJ family response regulator
MNPPVTIIVASAYKLLIGVLERAMNGTESIVRQVDANADTVLKSVSESQNPLVVLYERKGNDDWLNLAKSLQHSSPGLKTIAFGESSDIGAVARGIVHGLKNHVPLAFGSDLLEIQRIVTNAAGVDASADSIYGRAQAMLPSAKDGTSFRKAGKSLSAEEAIQQCVSLGLTPDETAELLGVSKGDANKVAGKARRKPSVGQLEVSGRLKVAGVLLIAFLALIGFVGRRQTRAVVPVSGTVRMNGVPLGNVIVYFSKEGGSHLSSGRTDGAGRYSLTTLQKGDGAEEGSHVVWVGVPSRIRDHIDMNDPQYAEKMVRLEEKMRAEREAKDKDKSASVPASYLDMRASPLRAEIKGREPVSLDFDLKK